MPGIWAQVKQWSKPVAGVLLVLPVIGVNLAGMAIYATVTLGVVVGAIVLVDHFKVA